jgi:16S rRNA (cytosine967-C5)-methyltransferase
LGNWTKKETIQQNIIHALFLTSNVSSELLENLSPVLNEKIAFSLEEKFQVLDINHDSLLELFPVSHLSTAIDKVNFTKSFFIQPAVFARIRPQKESAVIDKLESLSTNIKKIGGSLQFEQGTDVSTYFEINKEIVVQDLQSQHILDYLFDNQHLLLNNHESTLKVWDCCAASGGKSILLFDRLNQLPDLTVSDIRESILFNLKMRFKEAGIAHYRSLIVDLSKKDATIPFNEKFDLIVCDVPCTGSGTWSRTPEQIFFFEEKSIITFAALQLQITSNALTCLKKDGILVYITCSVFKEENEENVTRLLAHSNIELIHQNYWKGYDKRADTLFVAIFRNTKNTP